jgi:anti-anti-sigma factor
MMAAMNCHIWKGSPFCIQRADGDTSGLVVFRMSGPFTARDMYSSIAPAALEELFEFTIFCERPRTLILNMMAVPYLDSAGAGVIARYFSMCKREGIRMLAVGAGPRVRERFRTRGLDLLIPVRARTCEGSSWPLPQADELLSETTVSSKLPPLLLRESLQEADLSANVRSAPLASFVSEITNVRFQDR